VQCVKSAMCKYVIVTIGINAEKSHLTETVQLRSAAAKVSAEERRREINKEYFCVRRFSFMS
jgi:hypothetical protein